MDTAHPWLGTISSRDDAETDSCVAQALTQAVRSLYETHPYPRYPLLARPRWTEGYLTSSLFSNRLTRDLTRETRDLRGIAGHNNRQMEILIGGSGEILPFMIRKWEPREHQITCVDLSKKSLNRARLRLALVGKPTRWIQDDLAHFLSHSPAASFGHIDVFGVLHHMASPGRALDLIAKTLVPGGTVRLMVYNSDARDFIRHIQKVFALLLVTPHHPSDLAFARQLLAGVKEWSPRLETLFRQMGPGTLTNDARFADTFLHPRECSLDVTWWLERIEKSGMEIVGLLDRYAELDDLPNPLWCPPTKSVLKERALDRRFEGNLELFLRRPGGIPAALGQTQTAGSVACTGMHALRYGPPRSWFHFPETKTLPSLTRYALWHAHLAWTLHGRLRHERHLCEKIPFPALQRLARIGAILPGQITVKSIRKELEGRLSLKMDPPTFPKTSEPLTPRLVQLLATRLKERGLFSERKLAVIQERLARAATGRP